MTSTTGIELAERFTTAEDELFETLNDPDKGVALLKTPGLNPQQLVDDFAESLQTWQENPELGATVLFLGGALVGDAFESHPSGVVPVSFQQSFGKILLELESKVEDALLPHMGEFARFNKGHGALRATRAKVIQERHSDTNLVTAFMGASQSGHTMFLPDGKQIGIERLPANTALLTRQHNWLHKYPNFTLSDGIEHKVEWLGDSNLEFRAVGIQFIG